MRLTIDETKALGDAADIICEILRPQGEKVADATNKAVYSAIAGLFRPYIRQAEDPNFNVRDALNDNRAKLWGIKLWFWDVNEGNDNATALASTDYEEVIGLFGVAEVIREYVDDLHEEDSMEADDFEPFSTAKLETKMKQLRPSIWRGGGKATARIYYTLPNGNKGLCQVDLTRT